MHTFAVNKTYTQHLKWSAIMIDTTILHNSNSRLSNATPSLSDHYQHKLNVSLVLLSRATSAKMCVAYHLCALPTRRQPTSVLRSGSGALWRCSAPGAFSLELCHLKSPACAGFPIPQELFRIHPQYSDDHKFEFMAITLCSATSCISAWAPQQRKTYTLGSRPA